MCPDTLIPATVQAASPALHDQRALYRMCDTVFARLDKGGFASHRCNGNWLIVTFVTVGEVSFTGISVWTTPAFRLVPNVNHA
jgi:hypothetical protein